MNAHNSAHDEQRINAVHHSVAVHVRTGAALHGHKPHGDAQYPQRIRKINDAVCIGIARGCTVEREAGNKARSELRTGGDDGVIGDEAAVLGVPSVVGGAAVRAVRTDEREVFVIVFGILRDIAGDELVAAVRHAKMVDAEQGICSQIERFHAVVGADKHRELGGGGELEIRDKVPAALQKAQSGAARGVEGGDGVLSAVQKIQRRAARNVQRREPVCVYDNRVKRGAARKVECAAKSAARDVRRFDASYLKLAVYLDPCKAGLAVRFNAPGLGIEWIVA